jgi:hypothetical protein
MALLSNKHRINHAANDEGCSSTPVGLASIQARHFAVGVFDAICRFMGVALLQPHFAQTTVAAARFLP